MMKRLVLVGAIAGALAATTAFAQKNGAANLGTVHIPKKVMANGQPLAPGTYQVRATDESASAAVGEDPKSEQWIEFVRGGKVVGKEVATVVPSSDISKIAKGKRPKPNSSMVELLKGGDYWRVWINKGGTNYIINMPPAT
jgi:hypothetical protein